jgi:MFS family permease
VASPQSRHAVARRGVLAGTSAVARNRRLLRLQGAYALMSVFELGVWVTVLLWAYGVGGVRLAGLLSFVQLVPAALLAPLGGLLADRRRRDRALCCVYGAQGLAMVALAVALVGPAPVPVVAVAATTLTVVMAWTRPLHYAALGDLAQDPAEAAAANALSGTLEGAGYFIGPVLAGTLTSLSGAPLTCAVFAVTALAAAGFTWQLGLRRPAAVVGGRAVEVAGLVAGLRARPFVLGVLLLVGLAFALEGAWEVLGVTYAEQQLGDGPQGAGLLVGSLGVGSLLGGAAAVVLTRWRRLRGAVMGGLVVAGLPLVAMPYGHAVWLALLIGTVAGAGLGFFSVAGLTTLQRSVSGAHLGRVLGFRESALLGGTATGAVLAPLLVHFAGPGGSYAVVGAALLAAAAVALPLLIRVDARARFRPGVVELIQGVPFLAVLDVAAIEGLAQAAERVEAGAGTVVIRQGEPGDAFYLVESGRLEVSVRGRPERVVVEPGQGVGEIALLRSVPRTATVAATQPTTLWRLPRADFLRTVTGSAAEPLAQAEASAGLTRLASDDSGAG